MTMQENFGGKSVLAGRYGDLSVDHLFTRDCDRAGAELVRLAGGGRALRRSVRADAPLPKRK